MNFALIIILCLVSMSCSQQALKVTQYHLRGSQNLSQPSQMVRGEALYRYDQNLSKKDRKQKHGQYYILRWDKKLVNLNGEPLILEFRYRQSATGQTPQLIRKTFSPQAQPISEISVTGETYLKKGRILSWEALLKQGQKTIAREQSFLWD